LNQLQLEDYLVPLIAVQVFPLTDVMADVPKLTEVCVVAAAVRLLKQKEFAAVGLMVPDGPIPPSHFHVAYLTLAGV
jgi:hypothetical protein